MQVLLVDDDAGIRRVLRLALQLEDIDVIEASDGMEAIEMLRDHCPDVVTLDLMMPDIDGPHIIRNLNRVDGRPYVLVLSGLDHRVLDDDLMVDQFIQKPFDPGRVVRAIQQIARKSAAAGTQTKI